MSVAPGLERKAFPQRATAIAGGIAVTASIAIAACVSLAAGLDAEVPAWGAALALSLVAWLTLRERTVVGLIMVYGYLAIGVAAALFYYPSTHDYFGINSEVALLAGATPGYRYLAVFTVVAGSIWLAFFVLAPRPSLTSRGGISGFGLSATPVIALPAVALAAALVPLVLDAYGTGFHTILYASTYLERTGPPIAFKVGRALGAVGLIVCGHVFFANRELRRKIAAVVITVGYASIYLGTDTRFLALVVPLFCLGGLLTGRWSTRQRATALVISGLAAFVMIQVPLALRAEPNHGLIASVHYLFHDPGLLFSSPVNDILFGAPLTLYVAHDVPPLPAHELVTSLSPLPSFLTDWAQIEPTLGLNSVTPFPALGELLNHGWAYLIIVMGAIGAAYALLERAVKRSIVPGLGMLAVSAVAALAVLKSTEYDLRTFARLCYYAAAVVLALVLLPRFQQRSLNRRSSSPPTRSPIRP